MPSLLPLTFFEDFMPSRERVVVISDTQYAAYNRSEAEKQIAILQARADEHSRALATITSTIAGLKTEHGIEEPATEASN